MRIRGPQERRAAGGERPSLRATTAVALSILLNVLAGWGLWRAGALFVPGTPATSPVALAPLTAAEWDANRSISGAPRPPPRPIPAPPPPAKPRTEDPAGQLVQLPPGPDEQDAPKDAQYLAERNQNVEKETVSRDAGRYPNLLRRPDAGLAERDASGEEGRAQKPVPGREGSAPGQRGTGSDRLALPDQQPRERLALAPAPGGEHPLVPDRSRQQGMRGGGPGLQVPGGEGGERVEGLRVPDLKPSPESLSRIAGGPGMDAFDQEEEGDETRLNARSWDRAKYWNSVVAKIGPDWERRATSAIIDRDPGLQTFFYKERRVGIGFALDGSGRVAEAQVIESSNVDFYDRVAMTSILRQQPYPSPPGEALGDDGLVWFGITFIWPSPRRPPSVFLRSR